MITKCHMLQVLVFVVSGPVALLCKAADSVQVAVSTVWQGAKPLGQLARSASGLVRTTSLAATTSGASMADVGQQVSISLMCVPSVSPLAVPSVCFSPAHFLCVMPQCLAFVRISYVRLSCVSAMCVSFVCLLCLSPPCVSSVCLL